MRKKINSYIYRFKMPHLFRDDLEKIEDTIKELNPREYRLESNNFEYEKIEELPKNDAILNEFYIRTYSPYITINFKQDDANIYASCDDIKTVGAIKKTIDIVSARERKNLYRFLKSLFLVEILCVASASLILIKNEIEFSINRALIMCIFLIIAASLIFLPRKYFQHQFSIIEFSYKKNKFSFLKRNKEQIMLAFISAIIGAVVTCILQLILVSGIH